MAKLLYMGGSSLRIQIDEGKVIYIDPYAGNGYNLFADYILVSHEHLDSNNISIVKKSNPCFIVRSKDCISKDGKYNVFQDEYLKVISTPAGNMNHSIKNCVGFILLFDGLKIYYAGDTSYLPFMKDDLPKYNLDYAFLPCDGIYNMNVEEASNCAEIINAKHTIPIDTMVGGTYSQDVANRFICSTKMILLPNTEIIL